MKQNLSKKLFDFRMNDPKIVALVYILASSSRSLDVIKEIVILSAASLAISIILGGTLILYRITFN